MRARRHGSRLPNSYRIPDWQYRQAGEGEESGVLINLSPAGRVDIREGLARPEIDPDTRAETAGHPAAPSRPKPAYSAPLCRLIGWRKSAAVQELLLADPRKAREVAAVERLVNLAPHECLRFLAKEQGPGESYGVLLEQAKLAAGWLGLTIDEQRPFWEQFPPRGADARGIYEAVRALSDHELEQLHTLLAALAFGQAFCERLDTADSLFNRVARDLGADMRNHWRPDRAFLERRNRQQLAAIAAECGYAEGAGAVASYKKAELVNSLLWHFESAHAASEPTPAQIRARDWLPEAMLFPAVLSSDPSAEALAKEDDPDGADAQADEEPQAGD